MIVAGEASGDKHGASLARALARLYPEIKFDLFGSGGDEMRAAGVETLVDARDVAIIGVAEVARAILKLYRGYRKLLGAACARRPSAVVLVDWPDFNMRLAKKLHREGFKVIYYVSPQVWAWRRYRVRALRRDVDRMLVILPFEERFYRDAGMDVQYVGHPLADAVRVTVSRDEFCRRHGLDSARPIIALLPGSRHKEIHYHLPAMLDAAVRLRNADPSIADCGLRIADSGLRIGDAEHVSNPQSAVRNPQFAIPLASTVRPEDVDSMVSAERSQARLGVTVIERDTYNALGHADFAIVASGTATVEAALSGTPMVIVYRGSALNWRLIRPLIHLDTFGMVNLIAGSKIVPELMQQEVTGEKIAREVSAILSDPVRLSKMRQDLAQVRGLLAAAEEPGPDRAAKAVMEAVSRV